MEALVELSIYILGYSTKSQFDGCYFAEWLTSLLNYML